MKKQTQQSAPAITPTYHPAGRVRFAVYTENPVRDVLDISLSDSSTRSRQEVLRADKTAEKSQLTIRAEGPAGGTYA